MSEVVANRVCFVLVPGMDSDWFLDWRPGYQPNRWFTDGHQIPDDLTKAYPNAHIIQFSWSRDNTQRARNLAAEDLAALIKTFREDYDEIVVIAHSHGGNVGLQASQRAPGADLRLITLGTPFVHLVAEKSIHRIGLLFVALYAAPLFGATVGFVYNMLVGRNSVATAYLVTAFLLALFLFFYSRSTKSTRGLVSVLSSSRNGYALHLTILRSSIPSRHS